MFIFVLAGLVIVGVMLAPNLVLKVKARNREIEERTLTRLSDGLLTAIERWQAIPSATNWTAGLAPVVGLDQIEVTQVYPAFPADTNTSRVFLVDPGLPSGLLPYTQAVSGLTNSQTNLVGNYARAMLVSNTKRSLTLPVTSGTPSSNAFSAIWNWVYDPTTKAPPSSWPASWTGNGEFVHVQRLNLANEFQQVACRTLLYGVGETNTPGQLVTNLTTFFFLRGTRLTLAETNGTFKRIHVVKRDILFDFTPVKVVEAIVWWTFSETNGAVASNSGSLGSSANGSYTNGVTLGVAGPRPPTFSGFTAGNTAASFDGANDYVKGTNDLLDNLSGFTIAGWINPASASPLNMDLFGQQDIAQLDFTTASKLEFSCNAGAKKAFYSYPYGAGEWHHIAGVGDGVTMYLYVDGVQVATRAYATANYGSNSNPFNIGANVSASGNYFTGAIDEVVVYKRALSAAEIALLYQGAVF